MTGHNHQEKYPVVMEYEGKGSPVVVVKWDRGSIPIAESSSWASSPATPASFVVNGRVVGPA